jgi:hypothetical protein
MCIVLYGGYIFLQKINQKKEKQKKEKEKKTFFEQRKYLIYTILTTFLATIYIYIIGYCNNTGCFCEDENEAMYNHCIMHCIGSIGHMVIVVL